MIVFQIVHLLYLLSKFSSFPVKENKFSFQDSLDNVVESLNCHELGIISYGIYKMGLIISHPHLFSKIMNKALSEVEALNELALNCICIVSNKCKNIFSFIYCCFIC